MTSASPSCCFHAELAGLDRSTQAALGALACRLGSHLSKDIGLGAFEPSRGCAGYLERVRQDTPRREAGPAMRRNSGRFAAVAAAALCTLVILLGIDLLAVSAPQPGVVAQVAATVRS